MAVVCTMLVLVTAELKHELGIDISSEMLAKAQHRVEVDRHKIDMKEPIKTLGEHQVPLKLHRDVAAHVNVIVTQDR